MAFCTKCGSHLPDGAQFCNSCGAALNTASAAPAAPVPPVAPVAPVATAAPVTHQPAANKRQLHCPECKGMQISPIVESSLNGAVSTSRGNISASKFSNSHRNYWMCSTCGNKFRNIQNLQEEINAASKSVIIYSILTVIGIALCLFFCSLASEAGFLAIMYYSAILGSGAFALICFIYIFVSLGKASKMKKELAYLQYNCFN